MLRIIESRFIKSCTKPEHFPENPFLDIAFAGKSNVGKSSMLNTLTSRKLLAKKSNTPGKTRLINYFQITMKRDESIDKIFVNFVDLPGYGYAKVSLTEKDSWKKMMEQYFRERTQLRCVFLLVDIRHPADKKDMMMIEMLEQMDIPYCLIATKSDKIPKNKINSVANSLKKDLVSRKGTIIPFSSHTKSGIDEVLSWIEENIIS